MFRPLTFICALLFSFAAYAGVQAFSADQDLGLFAKIKCSTGLTCTKVGDKLSIVSSPTISTGDLTITGAEAGDATLTMKADESDDSGDDWLIKAAASGNALTLSNDTSGSQVAKFTLSTAGALTSVVSITGAGTGSLSGYLNATVAATATTITAAQCGSTFINSGAVEMELPEASTVVGCRLTFCTANASNFDIDPDAGDTILALTNAAGYSIRNATIGNCATIQALNASTWGTIATTGTWSDNN